MDPLGKPHEENLQDDFNSKNYSGFKKSLPQGSRTWHYRPRSPGLKWHKEYDTPESLKHGRVLLIDYVKQDLTKKGMRKVAAQEINNIEGLRRIYSNQDRGAEAVLRIFHVQNAWWATPFLLRKFNIKANDDLIGTDFGQFVKHRRFEGRGGKKILSGKTWKTTHDPWRGISRTSFGIDYLKPYRSRNGITQQDLDINEKMMELNCYDDEDNPTFGWDVYVQRLSCYVQYKEAPIEAPGEPDIDNPYNQNQKPQGPHDYVPRLESLDNGNTIIIFEDSHTGSIEDTIITARQQWESSHFIMKALAFSGYSLASPFNQMVQHDFLTKAYLYRWRRLPFYLAMEHEDISNDDGMATECMKLILQDVWKSVFETWENFLEICNNHVSILEDKIYDGPADETRAPELWTNSSMWLKIERLVSIHSAVVKEMQNHIRELTGDLAGEETWLESSMDDMERISNLVQEDLVKPTASLADLMYKSVEIRDSRHSLQLNTSLWRLSWITFIFLPLTFIVGFFGMNVDTFSDNPSIKWYFIVAAPMMVIVFLFWLVIKNFLARRRQTPYQRGIYESLFHDLATTYPQLWSRSGPRDVIKPQGFFDRLRWGLILYWNNPKKTIRAGPVGEDSEYDGLGAWSRLKRTLTRRWTSQIRKVHQRSDVTSTSSLEDGLINEGYVGSEGSGEGSAEGTELLTVPAVEHVENSPDVMLKLPALSPRRVSFQATSTERPSSKDSSVKRNSGVLVEEEKTTWLQDFGKKSQYLADWRSHPWGLRSENQDNGKRPTSVTSAPDVENAKADNTGDQEGTQSANIRNPH